MNTYGKNKNLDGMGGGVEPALDRNPNENVDLAGADGPFSHLLGLTGDGGVHGDKTVTSKGQTFTFK